MEQKKLKWYQFKMVNKIFGIHIKYFLPIAVVVYIAAWFGMMPDGFVGNFAFLMAVGGVLSWIGMITPLVRSIGGSLLLPLFGATVLSKLGAIPAVGTESAAALMDGGLQMLFVSAVLVGSILAMDRKLLLASVIRYIPVLIISQVFALGFAFVSALITGTSFYEAMFFIAAPCMTGGSSGAIATLPSLYSSILGTDVSAMGGPMLAVAMVGTYIATGMVVIMKVLAEKFPKAMGNGHGMLLQKESPALKEARENWVPYEDSSLDYSQLGGGLFLSVAVMVLGVILSSFIPQIVYVAMAIIVCIVLKGTGILPDELCKAANYWSQFTIKNLLVVLVTALGLNSMGGVSLGSVISVGTIVIIVLTFLGAVIGAMVGSKLLGLYRYEGSLTAALCACNIGASGDLQMLIIADRLDLLAFATISTRIGGALMLVEISIIFPLVARAMGVI